MSKGKKWIVICVDSSMTATVKELTSAFLEYNYEVIIMDINDNNNVIETFNKMLDEDVKIIIGINGTGMNMMIHGIPFYSVLNSPYCALYKASPAYYHDNLIASTQDSYTFFSDEKYVECALRQYPNLKNISVLPFGGIENGNVPKKWNERTKDVIYLGDYVNPQNILDRIDNIKNTEFSNLTLKVIERVLGNFDLTIDKAFADILLENYSESFKEECCIYMPYLSLLANEYIESYFVVHVIKVLIRAGIKVEVFGENWFEFESDDKQNLVIHGDVNETERSEVMSTAKIVLNIMPCSKHGCNDIIFTTMLSGAVCVTNLSTYIENEFSDNENIITYDFEQLSNLPELIRNLQKDDVNAERIANAGYERAKEKHTWKNRIKEIIRVIDFDEQSIIKSQIDKLTQHLLQLKYEEDIVYDAILFSWMKKIVKRVSASRQEACMDDLREKTVGNVLAQLAIYSFEFKYLEKAGCAGKLIELVSDKSKFNQKTRLGIYWYVQQCFFLNEKNKTEESERKLYELYAGIVREIKSECGLKYTFRGKNERSSDIVLVFTSQFLKMEHGPTKTALDRCKCLMESYGMQVILINTAECLYSDKCISLYNVECGNYVKRLSQASSLEYEGCVIPFYQCTKGMPNVEEIRQLAEMVWDINPYFILNIGGNSPASDICSEICPCLSISTVPSRLVNSLGQFQALGRHLTDEEKSELKRQGRADNYIIEGRFTSSLKPQNSILKRADLGLPEDKFVVIIVGGRLTYELDDELLYKLLHDTNDDVVVGIAGKYAQYEQKANETDGFSNKVINLGFQDDMLAVFDCCDLYVNPKRIGGGTSVIEAMHKGLPAVTLPFGDVGLGAGEDFCVADYDEMIGEINRYSKDSEYYNQKSNLAKEHAAEMLDTKKAFVQIIDELIERMN